MNDTHSHNLSRVIGTETEFGIASRDPERGGSCELHSCDRVLSETYPRRRPWDYENENPCWMRAGSRSMGNASVGEPDYIDSSIRSWPTVAVVCRRRASGIFTPECTNAREVVAFERVGERIIAQALARNHGARGRVNSFCIKTIPDGKGNSYGYHEDYLVSRRILRSNHAGPHAVSGDASHLCPARARSAPKIRPGCRLSDLAAGRFFETLVDLNTMVRRPIINTRDDRILIRPNIGVSM